MTEMQGVLEGDYFTWLYAKVAFALTPPQSYFKLCSILHSTEYEWTIIGDDNRAADGKYLRTDFFTQAQIDQDPTLMSEPCSVFEMLIGLACDCEFQAEEFSVAEWFWIFVYNLKLTEFGDDSRINVDLIAKRLDDFIWRNYDHNGIGGIFPLYNGPAKKDQREVELWYQFFDYLRDNDMM